MINNLSYKLPADVVSGGGGGGVVAVTASSPIASSGGANPNISAAAPWTLGVQFPLASIGVATNLYVSNAGNDLNNGDTALTPYLTIGRALNRIAASVVGGYWVINLAPGVYNESLVAPDMLGGRRNGTYGDSVIEILGDEVTPTNCTITNASTIFTIPRTSAVYRFRGVHFVGTGAANGITQQGSTCYVINSSFQDFITAISLSLNARFVFESSTTGGTITNCTTGISCGTGSTANVATGLTFTTLSGFCFLASSNANIFTSSGLTFTSTTAASTTAFAQSSTNGAVNFGGTSIFNLTNIQFPFRVITAGSIIQGNGTTINLTDCLIGGTVSENSYYQDGTTTGNTYNYLGTTPSAWQVNSNVTLFAPNSFNGADIQLSIQSGVVIGSWWRKQLTIAADYPLTSLDYSIKVSAGAPVNVTLPLSSDVGQGRIYIITDISGAAGANNITLTASGGDTINGAATFIINTNYGSATIEAITGGWSVT